MAKKNRFLLRRATSCHNLILETRKGIQFLRDAWTMLTARQPRPTKNLVRKKSHCKPVLTVFFLSTLVIISPTSIVSSVEAQQSQQKCYQKLNKCVTCKSGTLLCIHFSATAETAKINANSQQMARKDLSTLTTFHEKPCCVREILCCLFKCTAFQQNLTWP